MMKQGSMLAVSLCLALGVAAPAVAQMQSPDQMRDQDRERIYGYELMTPQEHSEYRAHMRSLKTEQEREAYRLEQHRKMQERARAQGKTLPDMPPAGMGPGMMGPGGGGMGPGGRPGGYGY
jgi:type III secretory pathway component EscR